MPSEEPSRNRPPSWRARGVRSEGSCRDPSGTSRAGPSTPASTPLRTRLLKARTSPCRVRADWGPGGLAPERSDPQTPDAASDRTASGRSSGRRSRVQPPDVEFEFQRVRHRVDRLNAHARLFGPETGSGAPELRGRAVDHGAGSARFYDHYALT